MSNNIQNVTINTEYVEGEPKDTIAVRLIANTLNSMLDNDYDRLRILNYHVQKIMDNVNIETARQSAAQMQEAPHGQAR